MYSLVSSVNQEELFFSSERFQNYLSDFLPSGGQETACIIAGYEEGIHREISTKPPDAVKSLIPQISQRLQSNQMLDPPFARWTAETWAFALGKLSDYECTTPDNIDALVKTTPLEAAKSLRIDQQFNFWKQDLFDYSRKNPLLFFHPTQSSSLEILKPNPLDLYRSLVIRSQTLAFPRYRIEPFTDNDSNHANRYRYNYVLVNQGHLHTDKTEGNLIHSLSNIRNLARASRNELGLNSLYLAFGLLSWMERSLPGITNLAPLLLVPVSVERKETDQYILKRLDDEALLNPTLHAYLADPRWNYNVVLPEFNEENDGDLRNYLADIEGVVSKLGWKVEYRAVLRLFSFQTIRLGEDLDEARQHKVYPAILRLLAGEKIPPPQPSQLNQPPDYDHDLHPKDFFQVMDADASQVEALVSSRLGWHMVIHGPPGTGKSQTIVNLIAQAILDGKTVLFVSQKKAALDVVYRRLAQLGLDGPCLPVHSDKANKRLILDELNRTYQSPHFVPDSKLDSDYETLYRLRQQINRVVSSLNTPFGALKWTAHQVEGWLFRLHQIPNLSQSMQLNISNVTDTTPEQWESLIHAAILYQQAIQGLGFSIEDHPWKDICQPITPAFQSEVNGVLQEALASLETIEVLSQELTSFLNLPLPEQMAEFLWLVELAGMLEKAPPLQRNWFDVSQRPLILEKLQLAEIESRQWRTLLDEIKKAGISNQILFCAQTKIIAEMHSGRQILSPYLTLPYQAGNSKMRSELEQIITSLDSTAQLFIKLADEQPGETGITLYPSQAQMTWVQQVFAWCAEVGPILDHWFDLDKLDKIIQSVENCLKKVNQSNASQANILKSWKPEILNQDLSQLQTFLNSYRNPIKRTFRSEYSNELQRFAGYWILAKKIRYRDLVNLSQELILLKDIFDWFLKENSVLVGYLGSQYHGADTDFSSIHNRLVTLRKIILTFRERGLPQYFKQILLQQRDNPTIWLQRFQKYQKAIEEFDAAFSQMKKFFNEPVIRGRISTANDLDAYRIRVFTREIKQTLQQLNLTYDQVTVYWQAGQSPTFEQAFYFLELAVQIVTIEAKFKSKTDELSQLFGIYFHGINTNWDETRQACEAAWSIQVFVLSGQPELSLVPPKGINQVDFINQISLSEETSRKKLAQKYQHLFQSGNLAFPRLETLFSIIGSWFSPGIEILSIKFPSLIAHDLHRWVQYLYDQREALVDWERFIRARSQVQSNGMNMIVKEIHDRNLDIALFPDMVRKKFFLLWISEIYQLYPELGEFQTRSHQNAVDKFRDMDSDLLNRQSRKVQVAWQSRLPILGGGVEDTQAGILKKEFNKRRGNLPLRRLFGKIPELLLSLKPCLMMSPLSVAAYLPLEQYQQHFDLVIFDEASQVRPSYAVGAMLRGKQVIMAGDEKQLPPTDFFQVTRENEETGEIDDVAEGIDSVSLESILNEFDRLPEIRDCKLLWHYRSKHESLIQFSNQTYYQGELITFPNPDILANRQAVRLEYVQGEYDRGNTRQNLIEARCVVELIRKYLKQIKQTSIEANRSSLGVITLSLAQESAVREELRHQIATGDPVLNAHLENLNEDAAGEEPFFIKTLERVQGDERDTIILTIGYGPDKQGRITQNFGPINIEGGERRLNVAITRARQELILVTSLKPEDIRLSEKSKQGLRNLRDYISYTQNPQVFNFEHKVTMTPPGVFEEALYEVLVAWGHKVDRQVGTGSFRIDLGIIGPTGDHYSVGVDCRGPTYASARIARDRERLRPQVLERMGWRIISVWSKDWANQPETSMRALKSFLESPGTSPTKVNRLKTYSRNSGGDNSNKSPSALKQHSVKEGGMRTYNSETDLINPPHLKAVYHFETYTAYQPGNFHPTNRLLNANAVQKRIIEIVKIEQPIHEELLYERLVTSFNIKESSSTFRPTYLTSLNHCIQEGKIAIDDHFYFLKGHEAKPRARVTRTGEEPRKIEHIAFQEIAEFVIQVVKNEYGISEPALIKETSKQMGYRVLTPARKDRLLETINRLIQVQRLEVRVGRVFIKK